MWTGNDLCDTRKSVLYFLERSISIQLFMQIDALQEVI